MKLIKKLMVLFLVFLITEINASTFVALEIPEEIKNSAETIQEYINLILIQNGLPQITTIPKNLMHMTLQFISKKDLSQQGLTKISQALTTVARQFSPFDITDSFIHAQFDVIGERERKSIVFVLNPQPEELKEIVQAIRKEFDAQRIPYEGTLDFLAHLSIGNTNNKHVINFLKSQKMIPPKPMQRFIVDSFVLKSAFKDFKTFNLTGRPSPVPTPSRPVTPELAVLHIDLQQLQNNLFQLNEQLSKLT